MGKLGGKNFYFISFYNCYFFLFSFYFLLYVKLNIMKIKIEKECRHKWNKSRNKDRGMGSYTCYYKGWSIDVWNVYSPKAAIRRINKLIKIGVL